MMSYGGDAHDIDSDLRYPFWLIIIDIERSKEGRPIDARDIDLWKWLR